MKRNRQIKKFINRIQLIGGNTMKGIIFKIILILFVLWLGGGIVTIMRVLEFGALPILIIGTAMFTAVGVIWRYQPKAKETALKKHD